MEDKERLYRIKVNQELGELVSGLEEELDRIRLKHAKKGTIGALRKEIFEFYVKNFESELSIFYKHCKNIWLDGEIDSEEKKGIIEKELHSRLSVEIEKHKESINSERSWSTQEKNNMIEKLESRMNSLVQQYITNIEIELLQSKKLDKQDNQIDKIKKSIYEYEAALSFAGEDRDYVEKVADILINNKISIFYDKYRKADLWGKDLYEHLDNVYRVKSNYCLLFISKHYEKKVWTTHERKSVQARALKENREYILPIRFDDTEIPGILNTTHYLDARKQTPLEIANCFLEKLEVKGQKIPTPNGSFIRNKDSLPIIKYFKVEPDEIEIGETAKLLWSIENAEPEIIIKNVHEKGGEGVYTFGGYLSGDYQVHPTDSVLYTLIVKNEKGEKSSTVQLKVKDG